MASQDENTYQAYAESFLRLVEKGKALPLGGNAPKPDTATPSPDAPVTLIFSPHPDDECIVGGLPLRLKREAGHRVVNVAVTMGSKKERQQPRLAELQAACGRIGFELCETAPNGLERITPDAREQDPEHWEAAVRTIAAILVEYEPKALFFPHLEDWNGTHVGVHLLVSDALDSLRSDFKTLLVETEYWRQMAAPNLMVESSVADLADLLEALSCHEGEVRRNPFHLLMPAWMQDNVRLGAEVVGGQGGEAPNYGFATLYRASIRRNGKTQPVWVGGRQLAKEESATDLFRDLA